MSAETPRIWTDLCSTHAYLERPGDAGDERITLDTPAWFAWLDAATTTRFAYPVDDPRQGYIVGVLTVRKEGRQRGGVYWSAYRRVGGRLRKVYLGSSAALTRARLDEVARSFVAEQAPPPPPAHAPARAESALPTGGAGTQATSIISPPVPTALDALSIQPHSMNAEVAGATGAAR